MIRKRYIAYLLFTVALVYIVSPWIFEKYFLFNEVLAFSGFALLTYKRFRIGGDTISRLVLLLLIWCAVHALVSLVRMDYLYYYLRNMVIFYSIFAYYVGYYCYPYLERYIRRIYNLLAFYIIVLLLFPVSTFLFERFGMATLFPVILKRISTCYFLPLLIVMNLIYAVQYNSATALLISLFFCLLFVSPGYRFFRQVIIAAFIAFALFFVSILPNLDIIRINYNPYSDRAIHEVMDSHPLLGMDGNSTWRLVLWKQVIFDHFPGNMFGLGFGTPVMQYYPVEDVEKIPSLPYVLGAHNSYVYLFGRLGVVYVFILLALLIKTAREFFYYKSYYYQNKTILVFFSFFAVSIIALFNPALETPIYASAYWLILGLLARVIRSREQTVTLT